MQCTHSLTYLPTHPLALLSCPQVEQAHTAAGTTPAIARHQFKLIECKDANNNTPLSEASAGGHPSTVQLLISLGGDLNYKAQYGRTPLYRAAFGGHFEAAKVRYTPISSTSTHALVIFGSVL